MWMFWFLGHSIDMHCAGFIFGTMNILQALDTAQVVDVSSIRPYTFSYGGNMIRKAKIMRKKKKKLKAYTNQIVNVKKKNGKVTWLSQDNM